MASGVSSPFGEISTAPAPETTVEACVPDWNPAAPAEIETLYMETVLLPSFATYTDVPSEEITTLRGDVPAAIVGITRAVKAPVDVLREYMEILEPPPFATYTDVPSGEIVMF